MFGSVRWMLLRSFIPLDVKSESQQCSLSQVSWASLLAPPSIQHSVTFTRVLCLNTLVCLNLTLRYMKILEVAAAVCKGHLGEKYWGKANAEWGIPVKPRAESDLVLQFSHQFSSLPERKKKYAAASSFPILSFPWSLTLVNDSTHYSDGVRNSN